MQAKLLGGGKAAAMPAAQRNSCAADMVQQHLNGSCSSVCVRCLDPMRSCKSINQSGAYRAGQLIVLLASGAHCHV